MVRQRPWSDHRRVARVGARYENQQTADKRCRYSDVRLLSADEAAATPGQDIALRFYRSSMIIKAALAWPWIAALSLRRFLGSYFEEC